ncbi:MAG: macro domain-containing protein [Chloroflexi bacterium]|nr:macro domain-containing protein [Chloroflexota bacterium]
METRINGITVALAQGDITELDCDAIVNAANSQLLLGSGVAGAIRRKGGPSIQEECLQIGSCEVGQAVITGAGELKARHVIHAVGPRMGEGGERGKLASAVRASLALAEEHALESIAFPAISTGVFGFPLEACASVMLRVLIDHTFEEHPHLKRIVVCLFDAHAYEVFAQEYRARLADLPEM